MQRVRTERDRFVNFVIKDSIDSIPDNHKFVGFAKFLDDNAGQFPDITAGQRRSMLSVIFSDPQIALVGKTYKEITNCNFAVGEATFENQGRSRVILQNKGLLRVYGEYGTGLFLGAEMICPKAEHLAHLLAWSHQQRLTVNQMLHMPFYHPTIEEGLRTALRDLSNELRQNKERLHNCEECYPGE